jgi:hypothetical protein
MQLSLADAAKLVGVSKSALFKAMKRGVISCVRDEVSGEWRVDVSELQRVYAVVSTGDKSVVTPQTDHGTAQNVSADWDRERQLFESRIAALESERDYLRQALQAESSERRQLTRLLTAPQTTADKGVDIQRVPWTLYVIALSALIAAGIAVWHVIGNTQQ